MNIEVVNEGKKRLPGLFLKMLFHYGVLMRRVIIKDDKGVVLVEIPLTLGVVGVVLAAPVGSIRNLLERLGPCFEAGQVVTDVGSTKALILKGADELLPPEAATPIIRPTRRRGSPYSTAWPRPARSWAR
mgnify:CR=1 FL=1